MTRGTEQQDAPEAWHFSVRVHPDVLDHVAKLGIEGVKKRCNLALRHLAAFGRTAEVKGTRGKNRGWRRSPLGGGSRYHFYLWWKMGPATGTRGRRQILVRAVRHHDNHQPMALGHPDAYSYVPFEAARPSMELDAVLAPPWTDDQRRFLERDVRLRLLRGFPGSGKTTALWESIRRSSSENVLYITWSGGLAESARRWFGGPDDHGFRPSANATIVAWDFATLLGDVLRRDVPRVPLAVARRQFRADLDALRLPPRKLGPWRRDPGRLFDEIRAGLWGRARVEPGRGDGLRLPVATWRERASRRGLAPAAIDVVVDLVGRMGLDRPTPVSRWAPELIAAATALARLDRGDRYGFLDGVDALYLDEVQDLCEVEQQVVVTLARNLDSHAPVVLAGDEGQTVRPTGFRAADLKSLFRAGLGEAVHDSELAGNLRSPPAIAAVVDRARRLYLDLTKRLRPRGRSGTSDDDLAAGSRVLLCRATSPTALRAALGDVLEVDGVQLLVIDDSQAEALPEDLRTAALTPAEAKGLEYRAVILLGLGSCLHTLADTNEASALDQMARRVSVDRLRVALSRATSILAAVELGDSPAEFQAATDLLKPDVVSLDSLVDLITADDRSLAERVENLMTEARALVAERPMRAWSRIEVMQRLIDRYPLEADDGLTRQADEALAEVAARVLLTGASRSVVPDHLRSKLVVRGSEAMERIGLAGWVEPLSMLAATTDAAQPAEDLAILLEVAGLPRSMGPPWLFTALAPQRQRWLRALCAPPSDTWRLVAEAPTGALWEAARAIDAGPSFEADEHDLRVREMSALARSTADHEAEIRLLGQLRGDHVVELSDAQERAGLIDMAAQTLVASGLTTEAVATARRHGRNDLARRVAGEADEEVVALLDELDRLMSTASALLDTGALTKAETARLAASLGLAGRAAVEDWSTRVASLADAQVLVSSLEQRNLEDRRRIETQKAELEAERLVGIERQAEAARRLEEATETQQRAEQRELTADARLASLKTAQSSVAAQAAELANERRTLASERAALERRTKALKRQAEEMSAAVAAAEGRADAASAQVQRLTRRLTDLEPLAAAAERASTEVKQWTARARDAERRAEEAERRLHELRPLRSNLVRRRPGRTLAGEDPNGDPSGDALPQDSPDGAHAAAVASGSKTAPELSPAHLAQIEAVRRGESTAIHLAETTMRDIEALKGLTRLTTLNLSGCTALRNLDGLEELTNLRYLGLSRTSVDDLSALEGLTQLETLRLAQTKVRDVTVLRALTKLTDLNLAGTAIETLLVLRELTQLTTLKLARCTALQSVGALQGLTALTTLDLARCTHLADLGGLARLTRLRSLDLQHCRSIRDLASLKDLTSLNLLDLQYCRHITDLRPLRRLTKLTKLNLAVCTKLTDLTGLEGLVNLRHLSLSQTPVSDLGALTRMTKLTSLRLKGTQVSAARKASLLATLPNLEIQA